MKKRAKWLALLIGVVYVTVFNRVQTDYPPRRLSKTVGGTTTQFLYDGLNPVQELGPSTPPASPLATANLLTGLGADEYFTRTIRSAGR
jgi:hypothetical protein